MTSFSNEHALPIPRVEAGNPLPIVDTEYALRVRAAGHIRIGIGPWLINPAGELFMQAHEASEKTLPGALGTMSETVLWRTPQPGEPLRIEQPSETIARGLIDELSLPDVQSLELRIPEKHGWMLHACPVAYHSARPTIMGIFPTLHIDAATSDRLLTEFRATEEVREVDFMSEQDIRQQPASMFRFGMKDLLLRWISDGYLGPDAGNTVPLPLSPPSDFGPVQDMDLASPLLADTAILDQAPRI